jgi:hypothetical protein
MVKEGDEMSSVRYKIFKEGRAMKIKIIAGEIVHKVSIFWLSGKGFIVRLFIIRKLIM